MSHFGFIILMVSEQKIFEYIVLTFTLYIAIATNQIKRFEQKSYETWRTTQ